MKYQYNKIENLRIAVKQIDGVLLTPESTFSFWRMIGRPRSWKGYKIGFGLQQGRVVGSVGGGLCQLSNLIFWMALHSPLSIKERWRHSYDVFPDMARTQPFGSGATCAFNYLDLRLKNESRTTFQFRFWVDETHLNGVLTASDELPYIYKVREADHVITQESWGAYSRHNRLIRETYAEDGTELLDEVVVVENHALMMYSPFLSSPEP